MKILKKIFRIIRNKYVFATLFIIVWVIFFDRYNYFFVRNLRKDLKELEDEKKYYQDEIIKDSTTLHLLLSSPANLERFGREQYLMKKDSEDIFLIIEDEELPQ